MITRIRKRFFAIAVVPMICLARATSVGGLWLLHTEATNMAEKERLRGDTI